MFTRRFAADAGNFPILRCCGLSKSFNRDLARDVTRRWAVDCVSIELRRGEILGLVGGPGAGKTSLLQCLCGLLRPDGGWIELLGERLKGGRCPSQIGYVPAVPLYYPFLTPRDVLHFKVAREPYSHSIHELVDRAMEELDLLGLESSAIATLSRDEIRRLAVAEVLVSGADVVLVDTSESDRDACGTVALDALRARAEWGTVVVLAARDASSVVHSATRLVLLEEGRASRCFALESGGEPVMSNVSRFPRVVAERIH